MIYSQNKRSFVMGMVWTDQGPEQSVAKSFAKGTRRPYVMAETMDQQHQPVHVVGVMSGEERPKARTLSAALAIGLIHPNAVVCQKLADNTAWFCVLHGGVPLAGEDVILPTHDADERLREHVAMRAPIVGDTLGAIALAEVLDDLESQLSDGRITKKQLASIEIQMPATSVKLVLQGALALSLLGGVGVAWWLYQTHMASQSARKAAMAKLTQSKEEAERLEAQRQQIIATFTKQVEDKRREMAAAQAGPLGQWESWERVRRSLPLTVNGYVPDSMECTPTKCSVNWKASTTLARFVDRAAIPGWVEDLDPSQTARSEIVLDPAAAAQTQVVIKQGDDAARLRLAIAQSLQFSVDASNVGAPVAAAFTPPPAPPETGLKPVDLGFTGDFRVQVAGPYALIKVREAISQLRQAPIALRSARWTQLPSTTPGVEIDGYWVFQAK